MEKLKSIFNSITKIFGFDIEKDINNYNLFLSHIKSISKPDLTSCQKQMESGYKCVDCQNDSLCLICPDCFDMNKHIGHRWEIFKGEGFCDCGDVDILKKEGFCSKHKGYFTDYNDMMNYVKNCFAINSIENINISLNNIFNLFIEKINAYYNENMDNDTKNKLEEEIFNMFDEFINFYTKIGENNSALFYLIIFKFTENFSFLTNHKCFNYYSENNEIKTIPSSLKEKHKCICPFFQIMINFLLLRENKYNNKEFFSSFMITIKNKLILSLSYIHSFPNLFNNNNLSKLREINYQLCTKTFTVLLYDEKNLFFFEEFLSEIYNNTVKNLIELKQYVFLFKLLISLKDFLEFFPNKEIILKIRQNYKIHGMIIDIICSLHNAIYFEKFEDAYSERLLDCEYNGLIIICYLTHLFDFDNKEGFNFIFNKFIEKIIEIKRKKENKEIKTYSPFISLYRAFSIFLNRFCFFYAIKNNVDLIEAFNFFVSNFPQMGGSNLFLFLFQELIKTFSFILYVDKFKSNTNMFLYNINYFSEKIYILTDITLMKYLLMTSEVQNNFNIKNIMNYTDIFNSNNSLKFFGTKNIFRNSKKLENLITENKANLNYINSVLKYLYYIIRDNSSMIFLCFSYTDNFRMEYNDQVLNSLLKNDSKKFFEIIKNKIYMFILSSGNLIIKRKISEYLENMNHDLFEDLINQILEKDCKKEEINYKYSFSLNKEKLKFCDIDYCYEKRRINSLINYLTGFQSDFNLLHTYISCNITIGENMYNKLLDIFFNKENIDSFLSFYKLLVTNEKYALLKDIFFFDFSKILCFYVETIGIQNIDRNIKTKLIRIFNHNKVKEINMKYIGYIKYIKKLLEIEEPVDNSEIKINKIIDIKNKFKNKFKKKEELIKNKYINNGIMREVERKVEEEIKEICQYCKKELDINLNNFYGIICNLTSDYFIDLLKQTPQKDRSNSRRFLTCKHKIHFNCFFKLIERIDNSNNNKIFKCPVCLRESNILICDYISLFKSNDNLIMKGMTLGENNLEEFYSLNDDSTEISFSNINIIFIEDYCSKLFNKTIKIEELNQENGNNLLKRIIKDFETFNVYYNLTSHKKEQIIIWKNILYTYRYLYKARIINSTDFLVNEFNMIYNDIINYNIFIINKYNISDIINKFIILLFILYDLNETNQNEIKNIFLNNILIFIFFAFYINNNAKNIEIFFKDKNTLRKAFEIFKLKYEIFLLFFIESNKENQILNFENVLSFLKESEKFKELINKYNNDNNIISNKENKYLELPQFKIITLPNNYNEFLVKYMNINCTNCNKKKDIYYICLFCGCKLCADKQCSTLYKEKEFNSISFHTKICSGGQGFFINNNSCICFVLKSELIITNNYIYLNALGENFRAGKSYDLKSEYLLNMNVLEENKQKYIDMNYNGKKFFFECPE